jgi:hypothetical protein
MPIVEVGWSHAITLDAKPVSVAEARAFVGRHLVEHRLLRIVGLARLVMSEMTTHAVLHGRHPFIATLSRSDTDVLLTVRGTSPVPWDAPGAQRTRARRGGLGVLDLLALDWGVGAEEATSTLWALVDTRRWWSPAAPPASAHVGLEAVPSRMTTSRSSRRGLPRRRAGRRGP